MRYFNVMILGPTQSPYEGSDGTNNLVLHLEMHNFFLNLCLKWGRKLISSFIWGF
jgi:hypothetical protein